MSRIAELLQRATVRTEGPWGDCTQPRLGVMAHYTAGTDASGLEYLLFDPKCTVSYNWLVLDDGTTVTVAPKDARAYHAGKCRPALGTPHYDDANSAFYGIAIAAEIGDRVTLPQFDAVVRLTASLFRSHQWPVEQVPFRLTDHAAQAWPRGRKVDTGTVMALDGLQRAVQAALLRAR